ncbi:thymidylate synthase, partial [Marinomonas arenicola]
KRFKSLPDNKYKALFIIQYLDLCQRIVDEGVSVENERTGKRCLTVINAVLTYDLSKGEFPLVTTRKSYW